MEQFASPFGIVELTEERERHVLAFHPEVAASRARFPEAIASPDEVRRSAHDPSVVKCYKQISNNRFLAIVVKTSPQRNFILTAYLTGRIQHRAL